MAQPDTTTNVNTNGSTNGSTIPTTSYPYPSTDSPIGNIASLHNKIALITGGSSGLGRAIAQAYAAAGAYIVSADLQEQPPRAPVVEAALNHDAEGAGAAGGAAAANAHVVHTNLDFTTPTVELVNGRWPARGEDGYGICKRQQRAVFVRTDVTSEESVENAVKVAVDVFGRLDIMVNCAGMFLPVLAYPLLLPFFLSFLAPVLPTHSTHST